MNEHRQTLAAALRAAAADLERELPPPGLLARIHAAQAVHAGEVAPAAHVATGAASATTFPTATPTAGTAAAGGGQAAPRRRGLRQPWAWPWLLPRGAAWGLACTTVLLGSLVLMLEQPAPPAVPETVLASGFVPLLPPERWPAAGGEAAPAWLVSAELSGERLAALGLPYDPARAGERVRAELLMQASGDVLAVRLLR
ncbi:MAG: hypothetical protein KF863_12120 [Rubrivivax sp.]|nr:hypothetical protein [Rubrivivax sp.]